MNFLTKKTIYKYAIAILSALLMGIIISMFGELSPWIIIACFAFILAMLFILKDPFYGLVLITFFLPFERIGSFELEGMTTVRVSQLLLLITFIIWVLYNLAQKKFDLAKNPLILPLALFLLANIFSFYNAENMERAISVFVFTVFTMLLTILIPNLVKNKKALQIIISVFLLSAFLVCVFGIYQFAGDVIGIPAELTGLREHYTKIVFGFPRIQSTFLEPLYFANYLLIPISLITVFFFKKQTKIKPILLLSLLILMVVNLVLTVSRGGYLGLMAVALVVFICCFKEIFAWRNLPLFMITLLIIAGGVIYFLKFSDEYFSIAIFTEQATEYEKGVSVDERLYTYKEAWKAFEYHPIIGIGTGNFGPFVSETVDTPEDGWLIVNNEPLEIMAETGLFGFISFIIITLVLIIRSISAIIKSKDEYLKAVMIALLAAFIGILVQYQTFSILYIMHVWFLIGLMIAVQNVINSNLKVQNSKPQLKS